MEPETEGTQIAEEELTVILDGERVFSTNITPEKKYVVRVPIDKDSYHEPIFLTGKEILSKLKQYVKTNSLLYYEEGRTFRLTDSPLLYSFVYEKPERIK